MSSRKSSLSINGIAFVFISLWIGSTFASQKKLCDKAHALFQCEVYSGKNFALCPIYADEKLTGIQYRFGQEENTELVYPNSGFDFKSFKSNYFSRYQVEYKRIKFSVGTYTYSLYSDYDGEATEGAERSAGVTVSNSSGAPDIQIPCTTIYTDNLKRIFPHVECDITDALGCP